MNCKKAINIYLMLDNKQPLPFLVALHIVTCKQCKIKINDLQHAFASLHPPFKVSLEEKIMQEIRLQKSYYPKVSDFYWIAGGIFLLLSVIFISYSDTLKFLKNTFGNNITISIYLILGIILSGYIGSYVATHLKKLQAIVNTIKLSL